MSTYEDENGKRTLSNAAILKFLFQQWARRPRALALIAALLLAATACDILAPLLAGRLVEVVSSPGSDASAAWTAFAMFAGLWGATLLLRNTGARVLTPFSTGNMRDMIVDAFGSVQRFSAQWHADTFAGSTVRKLGRGMWAYDTLSDVLLFGLFPTLLVLSGLTAIMLVRWPIVGMYVAFVVALFVLSAIWLSENYTKPAATASNRMDSRIGGAMADAVGNNVAVKSFGAETRETARFFTVAQRWRNVAMIVWYRFTNAWLVQNLLLIALQSGLLALLVWKWTLGEAGAGDVAFAIAAFLVMSGHLRNFGEQVQNMQRALGEIEDIAIFARTTPQIPDAAGAPEFKSGAGEIVFKDVAFRYAGQSAAIYEGVNLRIAPGETVALVGPTGGGKSTFVRLIQRLYDVDGGAILIDGQDVRIVSQSSLRASIAAVPQEPALFHRSIAENIAYARPDAPMEDVVAAATRARAHGFVQKLPKRYRTLVGERGVKLSGGERQRVALARAFLADAPILILDEATSSLDTHTEHEVQAAMKELMTNRTTIVIAHRLSTVREADCILVFDEGRIVEQGRHAELIERRGLYARLHAMSQGELLGDAA